MAERGLGPLEHVSHGLSYFAILLTSFTDNFIAFCRSWLDYTSFQLKQLMSKNLTLSDMGELS